MIRMRRVFLVSWLAVLMVLLYLRPAAAQVLHEPVTVSALKCEKGICTSEDGAGQVRAINNDGQGAGVLYAPQGSAQPQPGEQIFSPQPDSPVEVGGTGGAPAGDAAPDRRDRIRADRDTGPEPPGTHYYHVVFNPDPYPFKRMTSLDSVREDEVLVVRDRQKRILRVGRDLSVSRDYFWGSIVIDLEPGRWVPIPSVSADPRIVEWRTEPPVPMEFAADGADNVFVRSPAGGRHRLVWLSSASRDYFSGELPQKIKLGDVPAAMLPAMAPALRKKAQKVLDKIALNPLRTSPFESVLFPLVDYFRAFETGDLGPTCGSTYLDLALAQKGCCRHRSFAFTITALAAGIPTRYIENELHVFVEVWVPKLGWRRVNLGGAPLEEELLGGQGKTLYKERGPDPFPQPDAFRNASAPPPKGLAELQRGSKPGAGDGPMSQGKQPYEPPRPLARPDKHTGRMPRDRDHFSLDEIDRADEESSESESESASPPPATVRPGAPARPKRAVTYIEVTAAARDAFRGDSVAVDGRITAQGADAGGLSVEIYLVTGRLAQRVAETTTAADGRYRAMVEVPRNLALGEYRVMARAVGDERRAPSSTRKR
jgi:hypothetical protein